MAEVDWGGDKVGIKDFFGTYNPNKNWEFTFGNQKHAFSHGGSREFERYHVC
jgi:hypothetical protein